VPSIGGGGEGRGCCWNDKKTKNRGAQEVKSVKRGERLNRILMRSRGIGAARKREASRNINSRGGGQESLGMFNMKTGRERDCKWGV